ncbi:ATP-binding protein [Meiothermus taiwanensis]|uniref:AAA ATPase domain protein n=1 Tax=Meiothermus taiwanensis TaxID=172827 RepID=A0A399DXS3_9DEIN|nr:AAA family ATPase [Meiothermus taiwanensis]RIH76937.1 AAA ATPase domain protein [Meiothermus taiwanensis]
MPSACLYLLDEPHVRLGEARLELTPSRPTYLLVYLACQGAWVERERLADLLWPDSPEEEARHNLRVNLHRARSLPWAEALEVERDRLRFAVQTDVALFRAALGRADWEAAVKLHRRPFLQGFPWHNTPALEDWAALERESLLEAWQQAAQRHAETLQQAQQHPEACRLLAEILRYNLLSEDVLQNYLRAAYLAGQREAALRLYERFVQELERELGLEPMRATQELAASLRRAEPPPMAAPKPPPRIPLEVLRPPRLVGREAEQARLRHSTALLVHGEPGIGKTRLLQEVFPQAPLLRCREGLENLPFYPVLDYLRHHLDTLPDLGPYREDLARLLPEAYPGFTPPPAEPSSARARLLEALARALAPAGRLLFDDLQWADESTLELLLYLHNRGQAWVGAFRTHEAGPALAKVREALHSSGVEELALEPLENSTVQALLADLIGTPEGPPLFSSWLHRQTGGNPFFALETLKSLFENGVLRAEGGQWHTDLDEITQDYSELQIPPKVAEVVRRRVGRLSEAAQRVVQAASVVGEGFTPGLLADATGLSEWMVLDGLEQAEQAGILAGTRFVHDVLRQSVYGAVPSTRCKILHAQIARALGTQAEAAVLAEHWQRAGEKGKARELWLEAIHSYRQKGMQTQALVVLQRASETLEASEAGLLRAEVLLELGRFAEALAAVQGVKPQGQTLYQQAKAANIQAEAHIALGQVGEAEKTVQVLRLLLDQLDQQDQAGAIVDRRPFWLIESKVAHYLGQAEAAARLLAPLVGAPARDPLQATILTSLGATYDELGDPERAWPMHQQALALARDLGAKHVQVDICLNLLWSAIALSQVRNDPRPTKEALALGEEALKLGQYGGSEVLRNNLAFAYADLGCWELAREHYEWLAQHAADPSIRCIAWAQLVALYARINLTAQAAEALNQAIASVEQTDLYIAHIRVLISTLKYGNEAQVAQMMPYLRDQNIEPWLQEELEQALAEHAARNGLRR